MNHFNPGDKVRLIAPCQGRFEGEEGFVFDKDDWLEEADTEIEDDSRAMMLPDTDSFNTLVNFDGVRKSIPNDKLELI